MYKQPAFYIDMTACYGCKTCMVACIDGNNLPENILWRRVAEYSGGEWFEQKNNAYANNVFCYYLSISCNHCQEPACAKACPTTAMHKTSEGIVKVDHSKCVGCRYCEWNCPYSAPQYNSTIGKMTKCDFCYSKLMKGETPYCVASCPMRALKFGEYEDLVKEYGADNVIAPLPNPSLTKPNLVCTPSRNAKPLNSPEGKVCNPEEL